MKILIISNLYPPDIIGGYELGCSHVVEGLRGLGHNVYVLTSVGSKGGEESRTDRSLAQQFFMPLVSSKPDLIRSMLFDAKASILHNTYTSLNKIEAFKPDVIYIWNLLGIGGLAILDAVAATGIPWVAHLMDRLPEYLCSDIEEDVLEIYNVKNMELFRKGRYISMSVNLLDEIERLIGLDIIDVTKIIPGWVNADALPTRGGSYRENGLVRFVNSGAIMPHKGISLIIEAAKILETRGYHSFSIDFYGDGELSKFSEIVENSNLSAKIGFKGSIPQNRLIELYGNYDCFLFPTWPREPFGFAPVEAAAMGCFPIITAQCGIAEQMMDAIHCKKINQSAEELSLAMIDTMENVDFDLAARHNFELTRGRLSFRKCLEEIESLLEEISRTARPSDIDFTKIKLNVKLKHEIALETLDFKS